jgi:Fic family protein
MIMADVEGFGTRAAEGFPHGQPDQPVCGSTLADRTCPRQAASLQDYNRWNHGPHIECRSRREPRRHDRAAKHSRNLQAISHHPRWIIRWCTSARKWRRVVQRHRAWRKEAAARAAVAHLYFVCIHPFEDGNARIGRALAEKSLAQDLSQPSLIALAYTSERKHKDYYAVLERNNKDLQIDGWMTYFANTILQAQDNTIKRVDFYAAKAKFYEKLRDQINERQAKVIARMFRRASRASRAA